MDFQATLASAIKLSDDFKITDGMYEVLKNGQINKMLLVCSKEMNQVFLFPMKLKDENTKIIKIFAELEDLSPDFVQDITEEITFCKMEKIHVTGVTTNEEGNLIFEGYYSGLDVDIDQLKKNIDSIDSVAGCSVEIVS